MPSSAARALCMSWPCNAAVRGPRQCIMHANTAGGEAGGPARIAHAGRLEGSSFAVKELLHGEATPVRARKGKARATACAMLYRWQVARRLIGTAHRGVRAQRVRGCENLAFGCASRLPKQCPGHSGLGAKWGGGTRTGRPGRNAASGGARACSSVSLAV